jgi:sugar phosphate isomerase/epimerase
MNQHRRTFIKNIAGATGIGLLQGLPFSDAFALPAKGVQLSAHLWVYASKFPPHWDATPVLETAFFELAKAGYDGIELMEVNLQHDDAVSRLRALSRKHKLPVTGTSYNANMWDRERHDAILQDVVLVTGRLQELGAKTFGISVGDAQRKKTEAELDTQATTLREIINICQGRNIVPNLHNHTYELRNDMHDLKGTLERVPELKLGPDLNWLVRGGVDPVWFIQNYGHRMVYMHLRDQRADGKWSEALGEGATDFKAIAQALRQINYKGRAAVELAYDTPVVNSTAANWKKSRDFVRKTFGW